MKKRFGFIIAFLLWAACVQLSGTSAFAAASGVQYTPWDVEKASEGLDQREKKPYTLMIYMNGSDLESENGAATDDLIEILDSGADSSNVNIVLFTGGTRRWQNDVVPSRTCMVWEAADGWLYEVANVGLVNMGEAGTLGSFIQFAQKLYPADQYGLILWDHGGGSIAGYGRDERFNDGSLSLLDMQRAFEEAGLKENKLAFLGFDSCLMATAEMAVVASDYAQYLIASEDLEPGDGWDYRFLSVFNAWPEADGDAVGRAVTDSYMDYYGTDTDEILTMSVTDLSYADDVMNAMGALMERCSESLTADSLAASFKTLARKRSRTKTFGEGSVTDNECDMVDAGDMATQLRDLYPDEAQRLSAALDKAVTYNRHNSDTALKGLSAYYIYGGKMYGQEALAVYEGLQMDESYTQYLNRFFSLLVSGRRTQALNRGMTTTDGAADATTIPDDETVSVELVLWRRTDRLSDAESAPMYRMLGTAPLENMDVQNIKWPLVNGRPVCLRKIAQSRRNTLYAAPVSVNGKDCDLIILINNRHPDGKILGVRNDEGHIIQKGVDFIKKGDEIAIYYREKSFVGTDGGALVWFLDSPFKVDDALTLTWERAEGDDYFYSRRITDIRHDTHFTTPEPVGNR